MKTRKHKKTWAIVQYDNRPLSNLYQKLIQVNKDYCKLYGYKHFLKTHDVNLPHWWIKVKLCKELLETNQYCGVMWLDTDAAIYDASTSLDDFTKGADFFISKDPEIWGAPVNAGIWIVKHTKMGKRIMRDWFSHYDKHKWVKNNNVLPSSEPIDARRWKNPLTFSWYVNTTLSDYERNWAGINFEQGALYEKTIQNPTFTPYVKILPNSILSHWLPTTLHGSFVGHFFSMLKHITNHDQKYYIDKFLKERIKLQSMKTIKK